MNSAAQWFILRAGKEEEGPYSPADIRRLLDDGAIDWDTFAYTEGLTDWVKLRHTDIRAAWLTDTWCLAIGGFALLVVLTWGAFALGTPGRIALLAIAAAFYFIPAFLALRNHHHNTTAIVALNVLLGWTVIGWAAAFIWAVTKQSSVRTF